VTFNDGSHNASIFGLYFSAQEETANGTELSLSLDVMLWHSSGTEMKSLTLDLRPTPGCDCNISLAPGGMGYNTYGLPPFQVLTTNESKDVALRIDDFGPIGRVQNFTFGTGIVFTGNPSRPLSALLSVNAALSKTSSLSLGNFAIYNGTSPIVGTDYSRSLANLTARN
jgi:hypothetical protein